MGHPSRKKLRDKKNVAKKAKLDRRNLFGYLDLTPYNAIGETRGRRLDIKLK